MADYLSGAFNYAAGVSQQLLQAGINESAARNADERTRALYKDLYSPEAKVQQLKKAGLSVGLMYGQGAAGGTTSTAGAQANAGAPIAHDYFSLLGLKMQQAQIDNIKADTEQKQAEAKVTQETGIEGAKADIAQKLADAGHKEAAKALTEAQTKWTQLETSIKQATAQYNIEKAMNEATKIYEETQKIVAEARSAKVYADVDEASKKEYIEQRKLQTTEILKGLQLSDAQIHSLYQHVGIDKMNADTAQFNAQTDYNKLQEQVKQWAFQNELVKQGQENQRQMNAINAVTRVIGNLLMVGAMIYPPTRAAAGVAAAAGAGEAFNIWQTGG